ncbi:hypothetical protein BUALT_Bualt07G0066600 [Buddleja alternifolia]|uniref:Gustatory receptor n=1 Tax=Buddleja alternifolia TaxID=168488 RepID=A0AAV6XFB0_9LAMI|nr:hypothetical protein BUALT_Bualt07G0066600 [Buddleja alternifolia]
MAKTYTIIRTSIFTFLQNFQHFTSTPSLLAFPFAVSTLLSQSLISSSNIFPLIHARLTSLFLASGFPPSSELFAILNLKLTQTILGFLFVLPFTLSSLLISKASIIRALHNKQEKNHKFSSWIAIFNPLLVTQLCNSLVILSANATSFCIIVISFNVLDVLGLSSPKSILLLSAIGVVIYSIILANAYIICNLSLIISGTEKHGGFISILKACVLIRGRNGTALSLAVPINLAFAAIEALFQYRVVRAYNRAMAIDSSMVLEGMFIAYLYAILIVLDTIVGCLFLKSCKSDYQIDQDEIYSHQIEIQERDGKSFAKVKALEYLP